ncbi:ly6/PLAUR domain-containing protein 2-like [Hyla sarda]|uniref:ly6/PLAUR domain-containing protein 2-like n=1 Tax=Hyla sarda TaxID=327740 RepID=UPI0024C383C2|nr:ly6/PLAUR domain-containing protein 2-like [Hyla sarda]
MSVYSLKCYTCDAQFTNANCLTATNCSSNATSCLTSVASGGGYTAIVKTCEASCTPLTTTIAGISATVTCCSTDLCNYSAGASITSSYAAIILALGSVLTILKSSVL